MQPKPDLQQVTEGMMSSQDCSNVASFSGNTCYNIGCCGVLFGLVLNFAGFMLILKHSSKNLLCVLTRISICSILLDFSLTFVLLTSNLKVMHSYLALSYPIRALTDTKNDDALGDRVHLGVFCVVPKDTSICRLEESGIKPLTFPLEDNPLYLLSHNRPCEE